MARYFFHLHNDIDSPDEEGVEMDNLETARAHAFTSVRFSAAQSVQHHGHLVRHHRIDIENGAGQVLDSVTFNDAVSIED